MYPWVSRSIVQHEKTSLPPISIINGTHVKNKAIWHKWSADFLCFVFVCFAFALCSCQHVTYVCISVSVRELDSKIELLNKSISQMVERGFIFFYFEWSNDVPRSGGNSYWFWVYYSNRNGLRSSWVDSILYPLSHVLHNVIIREWYKKLSQREKKEWSLMVQAVVRNCPSKGTPRRAHYLWLKFNITISIDATSIQSIRLF